MKKNKIAYRCPVQTCSSAGKKIRGEEYKGKTPFYVQCGRGHKSKVEWIQTRIYINSYAGLVDEPIRLTDKVLADVNL